MSLTESHTQVARPLKVLVPLIQQDFEAAEKAGMEYYKRAGEKLNEVKEGHFSERPASEFYEWAQKTFGKKKDQTRTYMALGARDDAKSFTSLRHLNRETGRDVRPTSGLIRREWTAPVDAVAQKAREEARRLVSSQELTRRQEREAESKLGLRLIDIGFKVLAQELHPDKVGGSREAMSRLNRVRDRLKSNV